MKRAERMTQFLRSNGVTLGFGLALLVLAVLGVRWIASNRKEPPPRAVMQFTVVKVLPQQPAPKPPPTPIVPPKIVEQTQTTRVEVRATDIPPPDAPRPSSAPAGGGRLALAAEGEGPGDSFNLAGNPGGRSLLSGGGLGEGVGEGDGTGSRYGWYYARIASEIEDAFRRLKKVTAASTRVELRIWADESGRINRVQLVRSTGNPELDEAIQSVVGLRLREPPPRDIPMPMVARLTARRPK